jgi:predicted HTH domain antitoxin
MRTKTLSVRIDVDDYRFLTSFAETEGEDVSKAVREFVDMGRIMYAIDKYRKLEASVEKAAHLAGIPLIKLLNIMEEYGIQVNLELEDYLTSLQNIRKTW